jgi:hypothetical protein
VHLELLTVILWVLFALSLGLAVWGLARRSAKAVFLAALPAGVFAFFFFSDPFGRVVFAWPLTLLTAVLSLRWPGRRREWLLLAAGNGACAGGVLMWCRAFRLRRSLCRGRRQHSKSLRHPQGPDDAGSDHWWRSLSPVPGGAGLPSWRR